MIEFTGVDQAHEQIADLGAVLASQRAATNPYLRYLRMRNVPAYAAKFQVSYRFLIIA